MALWIPKGMISENSLKIIFFRFKTLPLNLYILWTHLKAVNLVKSKSVATKTCITIIYTRTYVYLKLPQNRDGATLKKNKYSDKSTNNLF